MIRRLALLAALLLAAPALAQTTCSSFTMAGIDGKLDRPVALIDLQARWHVPSWDALSAFVVEAGNLPPSTPYARQMACVGTALLIRRDTLAMPATPDLTCRPTAKSRDAAFLLGRRDPILRACGFPEPK